MVGDRCTAKSGIGLCPIWVKSARASQGAAAVHVRFTLKADKRGDASRSPLSANRVLTRRSKQLRNWITSSAWGDERRHITAAVADDTAACVRVAEGQR
jgi:hypothetical protein